MCDPRSCWAPAPYGPVVNLALIREFGYEYAAVSPWDGHLDYMTADKMNTENMNCFLKKVSEARPNEFNVMVLDSLVYIVYKNNPVELHLRYTSPASPFFHSRLSSKFSGDGTTLPGFHGVLIPSVTGPTRGM